MREEDYKVPFKVIAYAGDSKSQSEKALRAAREGDFEEAKKFLEEAEKGVIQAHQCQTSLVTEEANGNPVPVNIITVHSQDHLTMALIMSEIADDFINLYQRVAELEAKIKELEEREKN